MITCKRQQGQLKTSHAARQQWVQTPSTGLRHPSSFKEGAGKRCLECAAGVQPKERAFSHFTIVVGGEWRKQNNTITHPTASLNTGMGPSAKRVEKDDLRFFRCTGFCCWLYSLIEVVRPTRCSSALFCLFVCWRSLFRFRFAIQISLKV